MRRVLVGCVLVALIVLVLREARTGETNPSLTIFPAQGTPTSVVTPNANLVQAGEPFAPGTPLVLSGATTPGSTMSLAPNHVDARLFGWRGSGSCSSTNCHGRADSVRGVAPGSVGNEHQTWVRLDPHTQAYTVLLSERSKKIEQLYRGLTNKADARPELNAECLNCHVGQQVAESRVAPEFVHMEGVGCESCHGPSEHWASEHYASGWKWMPPEAKAARGMRDMRSIANRASVCVDCHVGKPGSEVNHDLIAAGHPRLRFEFASFHSIYPKHWDIGTEKQQAPDLELRAWVVGQLTSAKASLNLLKWRAENAPKNHPWPEFTEYDCASCHQDLSGPFSRSKKNAAEAGSAMGLPWNGWLNRVAVDSGSASGSKNQPKPRLTAIPWNTWHLPLLPFLEDRQLAPGTASSLAPLAKAMTQSNPKPEEIVQLVDRSTPALDNAIRMLDHRGLTALEARALMQSLAASTKTYELGRWDQVAQLYLALAAMHNGLSDLEQTPTPTSLEDAVRALTIQLKLKKGSETPLGPNPAETKSILEKIESLTGSGR